MNILKLLMATGSNGEEEKYTSVLANHGSYAYDVYTTDVLDITRALNDFALVGFGSIGVCSFQIGLNPGKQYTVTFDFILNAETSPVYRFASNSNLIDGVVDTLVIAGTGSYEETLSGGDWHGFIAHNVKSDFSVSGLSVKEVL